jgi:hypothetical protein
MKTAFLCSLLSLLWLLMPGCRMTSPATQSIPDLPAGPVVISDTAPLARGPWNDADSRQAALFLARQISSGQWVREFRRTYHREPAILIARLHNLAHGTISAEVFCRDMESLLSGWTQASLIPGADARAALRRGYPGQEQFTRTEVLHHWATGASADVLITGSISRSGGNDPGDPHTIYRVQMEIIDLTRSHKLQECEFIASKTNFFPE